MKGYKLEIMSAAGLIFAALLLAFTGFQTWSLLFEVTQNPLVALLGLVVFEGGMIYWWQVYKSGPAGTKQIATAVVMFIVGLLLVTGSTALHLGAIDPEAFGRETPSRLITIAVVVNLIAKLIYPLFDPAQKLNTKVSEAQADIMDQTFAALELKTEAMGAALAEAIAEDMASYVKSQVIGATRYIKTIEGTAHYVNRDGRREPLVAFEPIHLTQDDPADDPAEDPAEDRPKPAPMEKPTPLHPNPNGKGG